MTTIEGEEVKSRRKKVSKAEEPVMATPLDEEEEPKSALRQFLDHQISAVKEAGKALEGLIPDAFKTHTEQAVKEAVEGYRTLFNSIIDNVIGELDKAKMRAEEEAK